MALFFKTFGFQNGYVQKWGIIWMISYSCVFPHGHGERECVCIAPLLIVNLVAMHVFVHDTFPLMGLFPLG